MERKQVYFYIKFKKKKSNKHPSPSKIPPKQNKKHKNARMLAFAILTEKTNLVHGAVPVGISSLIGRFLPE